MFLKYGLAILLCAFFSMPAFTNQENLISVNDGFDSLELSPYVEYLEEPDLDFEQMIKVEKSKWKQSKSPYFKVDTESTWLRMKFYYDDLTIDDAAEWVVSIYDTRSKISEAYYSLGVGNGFHPLKHYDLSSTDTPLFRMNFIPGLEYEFYFKLEKHTARVSSIKLVKQSYYIKFLNKQYLIEGAFYGSIFVMFLFTFFIYFKTKQKTYLYYSFYVLSFGLTQIVNYTMFAKMFLGLDTSGFAVKFLSISGYYIMFVFHMLFIMHLFSMKKRNEKLYGLIEKFIYLIIFSLILEVSFFLMDFLEYRLTLIRIIFVCYLIITFCVLMILSFAKSFNAKLVLAAMIVPMFLGVVIAFNLKIENPVDPIKLLLIFRFSMIAGFVLLAFVLANKFNSMWKAKQEAETLKSRAESASDSKSQFLANMSHEIRTPLTAIIGYSETIRDNQELSDSKKSAYLATVIGSSHHLLNVINDILDVSKIESKKMVLESIPLSIPDFILSIQSLYDPLAQKKGIEFNVTYDYPLPSTVMGDSTRLKQVIINLLGNALKFTDQGSVSLHVNYDQEYENLIIKVSDSGIGMTEQECERIFESFTQADVSTTRTHGGTGLGLTIARNLCELMDGEVSVSSVSGVGSEFTIKIKSEVSSSSKQINNLEEILINTTELNADDSEHVQFSAKVLIAEDNKDIQELLVSIVEGFGCEVTACDNGSDAFIAFCDGEFDLVLTDINMPIISGVTLVRILRSNGEHLPIFAITANVMQHEVLEYLEVGCTEVIAKPVNRVKLAKSMIDHLPYNRMVDENFIKPLKNTQSQAGGGQKVQCQGRVLLAEDNLVNQEYISDVLTSLGLEVESVSDGEQALEKCLSDSFDLVLLDLNMPKASGYEVLDVLKQMSYAVPVYALTADNSESSKARCLQSGFLDCLNKPIEKDNLLQALGTHLQVKNIQDVKESKNNESDSVDFKIRFTESLTKLLADLDSAKTENNWDEIKSITHQLKGAAGSFGYESITELSKNLERTLNENKDNEGHDVELEFKKLTARIKEVTTLYSSWKSNLY
jgi:signal transduction histidine kinase/DNA-binding response OmpR family regulator